MERGRAVLRPRGGRRSAVGTLLAGAGGLAVAPGLVRPRALAAQVQALAASGSGVNVKEMPGPDGTGAVPLRESFAFDAHYAQCIIEDNPAAFAMDTHSMGRVVIEAHSFFMAMYADELSLTGIRPGVGGGYVATLMGHLVCATAARAATVAVGSRTETEPALFEIEAADGGPGGGPAGDRFAFTVFFDPAQAPLNHALFGPRPTFTGEMVAGEITIATPVTRSPTG